MFRMWGKIWKDNHLIQDVVVINEDSSQTRTKKVLNGLNQICYELDLSVPIWLDANIRDFQRVSRTRFRAENFVEQISFDALEIQVIEEDDSF